MLYKAYSKKLVFGSNLFCATRTFLRQIAFSVLCSIFISIEQSPLTSHCCLKWKTTFIRRDLANHFYEANDEIVIFAAVNGKTSYQLPKCLLIRISCKNILLIDKKKSCRQLFVKGDSTTVVNKSCVLFPRNSSLLKMIILLWKGSSNNMSCDDKLKSNIRMKRPSLIRQSVFSRKRERERRQQQ